MKINKLFIFGAGVTGLSAYKFCKFNKIEVGVWDDNPLALQKIDPTDVKRSLEGFEIILLSPGIPPDNPFIQEARLKNIKIISDLEMYKVFSPSYTKIIAVTGSNGKSTTSSLIYHVLKVLGLKTALTGNIGESPLSEEALKAEACVMEVSSFQAEITNFIYDIGILLNITPDHIEYHGTLEKYAFAKEKVPFNSNLAIVGIDTPLSEKVFEKLNIIKDRIIPISLTKKLPGGYSIINGKLFYGMDEIMSDIYFDNLIGMHNLQNILACIVVCLEVYKVSLPKIIEIIKTFKGLPHRIEFLGKCQGVDFINDSKATNVDATLTALKALTGKNIFLIAGGIAKEEGIEALLEREDFKKVKEIILIGRAAGEFAKSIISYNKNPSFAPVKYFIAGTLSKAVEVAFLSAKKMKNSVILLSPACASFDQFQNYNDRGEHFRNAFKKLDDVS